MRDTHIGLVLAALGACVSCTDATASNPRSYTAISWDGVNTPERFYCPPTSDTTSWIYRAELYLQSPDTLRVTIYLFVAADPSQPISTWQQEDTIEYLWLGDSLVTSPDSLPLGARSGKNIDVTISWVPPPSAACHLNTHRFVFAP